MPTITCNSCQFTGFVPTTAVGQSVRCRRCGNMILVPTTTPSPPPTTGQAPQFDFGDGPATTSAATAREPWYYHYCYTATIFLLYFSMAMVLFTAVIWLGLGALAAAKAPESRFADAFIAYIFGTLFYFVGALLTILYLLYTFSFVLIFIDAARHVRRIHAHMVGDKG